VRWAPRSKTEAGASPEGCCRELTTAGSSASSASGRNLLERPQRRVEREGRPEGRALVEVRRDQLHGRRQRPFAARRGRNRQPGMTGEVERCGVERDIRGAVREQLMDRRLLVEQLRSKPRNGRGHKRLVLIERVGDTVR